MLVDIRGYEGRYQVGDDGSVWSCLSSKFLAQQTRQDGYLFVTLCSAQGVRKTIPVSRLVAMAFLGEPRGRLQVNHIDGVKTNNSVRNLEWVTQAENYRHAIEVLGYPPPRNPGRPILRISKSGEVKRYSCGMDAVRDGFVSSCISEACHGISRHHRGYRWEFA